MFRSTAIRSRLADAHLAGRSAWLACTCLGLACGGESSAEEQGGDENTGGSQGSAQTSAGGAMGGSSPEQELPIDAGAPSTQGAFWLFLANAGGGTCPVTNEYRLPADARQTVTGNTGIGERIIDGEAGATVECKVGLALGSEDVYELVLHFASGEIGSFQAGGIAKLGEGNPLRVSLVTTSLSLAPGDCTARAKIINPLGAVWLDSFSCPTLRDPGSPAVGCALTGGVIFENCR